MTFGNELASIYRRDLIRLKQQLAAFPDRESIWHTVPGITNSAGNLALHLEGNLREYMGRQLGKHPYKRTRPLEFSERGPAVEDLMARVETLSIFIPEVLDNISDEGMQEPFPEDFLGVRLTTRQALVHLSGHLQWHLGQIDYLRRVLTAGAALVPEGL